MTNQSSVPLSLALQQGPMLRAMGRMALQGMRPGRRPTCNPDGFVPATMTIPAPSMKLVRSYLDWSGAGERYGTALPPHLFCQWALPASVQVLEQTRYRLASVINQGVTMRVNGELPSGQPLIVTARLASLQEVNNRARVSVEITSGPASQPDAVVGTMHVSFILGHQDKKAGRDADAQPDWRTLGTWKASGDDGFRFALLTGDFNPIHWVGLAGRLSPFKQKVLHGFGMFVRSIEVLARSGAIDEIDVRFLKPVPLPSRLLHVQDAADAQGRKLLRLVGSEEVVHMAGHYRQG